jgi:hypothetical protein
MGKYATARVFYGVYILLSNFKFIPNMQIEMFVHN